MVLRGGAEQFIEEAARSLNDAIEIVRRSVKNATIVPGGGAIDMELSRHLRDFARGVAGKGQLFINAFAKALEAGAYTRPLFSSTSAIPDTKYTLSTP